MSMTLESHPKLVNAILHIACNPNLKNLDSVKLWKILYYADSLFCKKHDRYITETKYIKLSNGPAPESGEAILNRLKEQNIISINQKQFGNDSNIFAISANTTPELGVFEKEERLFLDGIIEDFSTKSAKELSDLIHLHAGWVFTESFQEINPLYSKYLGKEEAGL